MAENLKEKLQEQVDAYNELNKKKQELEVEINRVSQDLLKKLGAIEMLQNLNKEDKKDD
jgi:predicted nuclease with TOPRIM domain